MIINLTKEYVFLESPRVASRSMKAYLMAIARDEDTVTVVNKLGGEHCMRVPELFQTYFTVLPVRNPYERVLSHYFHRSKVGLVASGMSFRQYLEALLAIPMGASSEVFGYRDCICDYLGDQQVHGIIRFENLRTEFFTFCRKYYIESVVRPLHLSNIGASNREKRYMYDEALADMVFELAQPDFERFDYARTSWKDVGL